MRLVEIDAVTRAAQSTSVLNEAHCWENPSVLQYLLRRSFFIVLEVSLNARLFEKIHNSKIKKEDIDQDVVLKKKVFKK